MLVFSHGLYKIHTSSSYIYINTVVVFSVTSACIVMLYLQEGEALALTIF